MRFSRLAPPAAIALAAALGARNADATIDTLLGTKPGDLTNGGQFVDADTCMNCHGNGFEGDKTYLPSDTWAGTMMANAARDPVYFAALSVANQDVPGVGSYCLHCHSPIGFVRGHATPPDGSAFDAIDQQGVGCDTCHRTVAPHLSSDPYVVSDAQIFYDDDHAKRGPYLECDPMGGPPGCAMSPAHAIHQEGGLASATFCGQCHQVTNPDRMLKDATGADTANEFPLDTTYGEWLASSYATTGGPDSKTCQDCHMQKKVGDFPVATIFGAPTRTDPLEHAFVGGNMFGIQAVMAAHPDRAMAYPDAFALAQQRTLENLSQSVAVTMTGAPTTGKPGDTLTLDVKVENLTGHKFPTGYAESRRAWVSIALADAAMNETFLVGAYDAATGEIATNPETRIYFAQHGQWNGTTGVPESHLALHDMVLVDSRIPPKGFTPGPTTAIIGPIDYSDGMGGVNDFDHTSFTVTLPAGFYGVATLSARVYYQSMTKDYVDFLATEDATDSNGADLASIYTQVGEAPPILIAHADAPIDFGPAPTGSGGAGGTGATTGAATSGAGGSGGSADDGGSSDGCDCTIDGAPVGGAGALVVAALAAAGALGRRRRGARGRRV